MRTHARTAIVVLTVGISALALTGCSPARGADGRVTQSTEMPSTDATVGDCFTFVDGSNFGRATVVPCADAHTYVVIDAGSLTADEVATAGGAQNAVTTACKDPFKAFVAGMTDGLKREQQFIVSQEGAGTDLVTNYSCLSTDAVVSAAN